MGADESSLKDNNEKYTVSGQILISVHGSSGTGKTSLINQFIQKPFDSNYYPTKQMESRQVIWKSIQRPEKTYRVVVWDIIEAITVSPKPLDTISRADGIIILYNPDDEISVEYALSILYKLPIDNSTKKSEIPVLILSNFLDLRGRQKVHQRLRNVPYPQIQTSIKNGIGIDIAAIWLDRAILYNKQRSLKAQLKSVREEREQLAKDIQFSSEKNDEDTVLRPNRSKLRVRSYGADERRKTSMPPLSQLLMEKVDDEKTASSNEEEKNEDKNEATDDQNSAETVKSGETENSDENERSEKEEKSNKNCNESEQNNDEKDNENNCFSDEEKANKNSNESEQNDDGKGVSNENSTGDEIADIKYNENEQIEHEKNAANENSTDDENKDSNENEQINDEIVVANENSTGDETADTNSNENESEFNVIANSNEVLIEEEEEVM